MESEKREKKITRKTGYRVWLYGERYWHRTLAGAEKRYMEAVRTYCPQAQIIEVATGDLVAGRPQ